MWKAFLRGQGGHENDNDEDEEPGKGSKIICEDRKISTDLGEELSLAEKETGTFKEEMTQTIDYDYQWVAFADGTVEEKKVVTTEGSGSVTNHGMIPDPTTASPVNEMFRSRARSIRVDTGCHIR